MQKEQKECCGLCQYHKPEGNIFPPDWICTNPESENYSDYTEYSDKCEQFEERVSRQKER